MIVAAAVKVGSLICSMPQPARHHDLLRQMALNGQRDYGCEEQGFVTDAGVFLDRKEAFKHAHQCGQGTPRRDDLLKANPNNYDGMELYSEDLW